MTELPALPNISSARLPASYEAAKRALSECSRLDECQEWADKAEALASYAKQANDDQLRKMADRIQARAIRRCGELLKQIEPKSLENLKQNRRADTDPSVTRQQVAADAGLSDRQRKTALRVASVPEQSFAEQVESDNPPTITQLAEQGKKPLVDIGNSSPRNFADATRALAQLKRFAEFAAFHDPSEVANGVRPAEYAAARKYVRAIDGWLDAFITRLGD